MILTNLSDIQSTSIVWFLGSHFIQSLCDHLSSEEPAKKNIYQVFHQTQSDVNSKVIEDIAKQTCFMGTSLQKFVIFQKASVDKRGVLLKESDIM